MKLEIAIIGAGGRMGTRIDALASSDPSVEVVERFQREKEGERELAHRAKVLVDFSSEKGTRAAIEIAKSTNAALLVGTTGLPDAVKDELKALSASHAVLVAPNTSLGVAVTLSAAGSSDPDAADPGAAALTACAAAAGPGGVAAARCSCGS